MKSSPAEPRVFIVTTQTHVYARDAKEAAERVREAVAKVTPGPVESRTVPVEHVPMDGSCLWCEPVERLKREGAMPVG